MGDPEVVEPAPDDQFAPRPDRGRLGGWGDGCRGQGTPPVGFRVVGDAVAVQYLPGLCRGGAAPDQELATGPRPDEAASMTGGCVRRHRRGRENLPSTPRQLRQAPR